MKKGVKGWAGWVFRFQDERNIVSRSCALRGRRSCRDERRWERWAGKHPETNGRNGGGFMEMAAEAATCKDPVGKTLPRKKSLASPKRVCPR